MLKRATSSHFKISPWHGRLMAVPVHPTSNPELSHIHYDCLSVNEFMVIRQATFTSSGFRNVSV